MRLSLDLTPGEMQVVDTLCEKKGLTKSSLLKQCLRLFSAIEQKLEAGEKLYFEDKDKQKSEVFLV